MGKYETTAKGRRDVLRGVLGVSVCAAVLGAADARTSPVSSEPQPGAQPCGMVTPLNVATWSASGCERSGGRSVVAVSDLATLRAMTASQMADAEHVRLGRVHPDGPVLNERFDWVARGSLAANGYTIIHPSGEGDCLAHGCMVGKNPRDAVDVSQTGAYGDGKHFDDGAIAAATSIICSNPAGGTVWFSAGTYNIHNTATPITIHAAACPNLTWKARSRRAATIYSAAGNTITIQGGRGSGSSGSFTFNGLNFTNVSLFYRDYVNYLEVSGSYFTYNVHQNTIGTTTISPMPFLAKGVFKDNDFNTVHRAIYAYSGYGQIDFIHNTVTRAAQQGFQAGGQTIGDMTQLGVVNVRDNTITSVGYFDGANQCGSNYSNAMYLYAANAHVSHNTIQGVKCTTYWEVDGIYVKAINFTIDHNELHNAGYRSEIQAKRLSSTGNDGDVDTLSGVIDHNEIVVDETSGFTGTSSDVFWALQGVVFGGINVATSNTTVTGNTIRGAGIAMTCVDSQNATYAPDVSWIGNTTSGTRGAGEIWDFCAGKNHVVSGNKFLDPAPSLIPRGDTVPYSYFVFSSNMSPANSYVCPGNPPIWACSWPQYIGREIDGLTIVDNFSRAAVTINDPGKGHRSANILRLYATDADAGGTYPKHAGSFRNVTIRRNDFSLTNAGTGATNGIYLAGPLARFANLDVGADNRVTVSAGASAFSMPSGYAGGRGVHDATSK